MPQEGGGLGRAWTLQGPKVPLVPKLRWSAGVHGDSGHRRAILLRFGCVIYTCQTCKMHQKWKIDCFVKYYPLQPKQSHLFQMPIQCCICINSRITHYCMNKFKTCYQIGVPFLGCYAEMGFNIVVTPLNYCIAMESSWGHIHCKGTCNVTTYEEPSIQSTFHRCCTNNWNDASLYGLICNLLANKSPYLGNGAR